MRTCEQCGADLGPLDTIQPTSTREWCSTACADKATANEPGWVAVGDMPPTLRGTPEALLDSLRTSEDKPFTNPFGERVWLKPIYNAEGKQSGLTECCLVDEPCPRHALRPHGGAS
jgi:hypothetical protein